jgi:hypothetical protein
MQISDPAIFQVLNECHFELQVVTWGGLCVPGGGLASGAGDGASAAGEQASGSAPDPPAPAATAATPPPPLAAATRADRHHDPRLRGSIVRVHAAAAALPLRHLHVDAQRLRLLFPRQGGGQQLPGHAALRPGDGIQQRPWGPTQPAPRQPSQASDRGAHGPGHGPRWGASGPRLTSSTKMKKKNF